MQTLEKMEVVHTPFETETLKLKKRNRWLGWLAGILAVAVVGLGVWLIAELASGDGASLPAEVESVLDGYEAATEASDRAAFLAVTTEDYSFTYESTEYSQLTKANSISSDTYFNAETLDQTVMGDGPYYIGRAQRVQEVEDGPFFEGQSILTVVKVDGAWKVQQHTWIGETVG